MHSHAVDDHVLYTCQRAAVQASHAVAAHACVPLAMIPAKGKAVCGASVAKCRQRGLSRSMLCSAHAFTSRPRCQQRCGSATASPLRKGSPLSGLEDFIHNAQRRLCTQFEALDGSGASFGVDAWQRDGGAAGSGCTRVLADGLVFEKAAVNVSVLRGTLTRERASAMSQRGRPGVDPAGGQGYEAVALSLVFHSARPALPTFRADIRAFAVDDTEPFYGGGADLTPSYVHEDDAVSWHTHWADLCDAHQAPQQPPRALYKLYKRSCDSYFYLPARKEHRGIGGVFFDDVKATTSASTEIAPVCGERFTMAVCDNWVDAYAPIIERRRKTPFTQAQRTWQLQRRGRYLEFNLLYDRGVRFGLDTGRFESIMVSAPPIIRWDYNVTPEPASPEEDTLQVLRNPRDWVP